MALTNTQIRALARDHAFRVVDNMDMSTLIEYAVDQLADSFDVDIDYLAQDIIDYEGGDLHSASEFMIGAGFTNEEVDEVLGLTEDS